jgi:putative ABC transport system ATP-binding protein
MMSLLTVENINYFYQDGDTQRYILKDVSCEFEKGKFYSVLGVSGSGKTTLLSLLSALDKPSSGKIYYEGETIEKIGLINYRRNKTGIVFQSYNLIPYMTAVENVLVAMGITENKLPPDQSGVAYNLLDYIGIDREKADRKVTTLSGGEQQRVAIARALSTNVDLILADEPTGNLNEEMAEEIVETLKNLAHEHNKCVIIVTHSTQIAEKSDIVFKLSRGELVRDNDEDINKSLIGEGKDERFFN